MGHAALVGLDIAAGAKAIAALEKAGIPVAVGLWMSTPDFEDGRVFIASPVLDQEDRRAAYDRVALALHDGLAEIPPSVSILRMNDPLVEELRQLFGDAVPVQGMRLGGQVIGNRFVNEAYVYQIR